MPRYSINGHTYESDKELSDDEIDEIGGWDSQPDDKNLWEKANTPFTNIPSRMGKAVGQWIDPEQGTDWRDPRTALGAFAESVGSTVEDMFFTPMGAATAVAFPGATLLGKAALNPALKAAPKVAGALSNTAKGVHTGGRVASGLYAAEGAKHGVESAFEGDIPGALMGGLGAYLGQRGARYGYNAPQPPRRPPPLGPPGLGYVPQPAQRSYPPGLGQAPPIRQTPPPGGPPPPPPPGAPPSGPPGYGRPMPPPNIAPPNVSNPAIDDIAETIRNISRGQRPVPPPVEDPFTPVPERPYDPRDPRVMPDEPIMEPPPSGEVGPPPTPAMPPEITAPNMIPERPILDRTLTQNTTIDPLSEMAARRSQRGVEPEVVPEVVGPPARTMADHAAEADAELAARGLTSRGTPPPDITVQPEPVPAIEAPPVVPEPQYVVYDSQGGVRPLRGVGADTYVARPGETYGVEGPRGFEVIDDKGGKYIDEPVIPEPTPVPAPEPVAQPTPAQQFADQVVPPTQAQAINQAMAPKKKGLQPRQKFQTKTFPPGPPRGATAPPVQAAVQPKPVKPTAQPAPELEHIIATNADQLDQYTTEGYKVVGKRTDGAIVMERPATVPEAPVKPAQQSLAAEIEGARATQRAQYEQMRRTNAVKWGSTRSKAKAVGVDLKGVNDIKTAEKMIQAKDPSWTTPEVAGGGQGPSTASERAPKKKQPWQPGGLKHGKRFDPAPEPDTGFRRWYNEARGLMSVDFPWMTSAAFRQGLPFIGTKYWRSAFSRAAKAYNSQEAYRQIHNSIEIDPLYQPTFDPRQINPKMGLSIGEIAGLKFIKPGEIAGAEGVTRGPLTSKLRYPAASDRSFAAFTNHLRAWTFKRLLKDAGIWDEVNRKITNEPLAREIADFVNTASGRGKLEVGWGYKKGQKYSFEQSAKILTDAFFSPRLMFSRMKMMNPATYAQASPFVRKQYTAAMIRTIGAWWTIASLAEWGGKLSGVDVKVSKDPNNADYGKIRIGNTRIDPGGGFQQFLVATHRLMPNIGKHRPAGTPIAAIDLALGLLSSGGGTTTSSVTGNKSILGRGYKAETRGDIAERFLISKAHPTLKLAYDALHASEKYPVYLGDRLLQMAAPMMVPDVIEAMQNDPEMAPMIFFASNLGMGAQTYEGGRVEKPAIMPKFLQKYDYAIGGK